MSKIIIGIDVGGSITKIVGLRSNELITPVSVKANDPTASLFGAFGKFVDANGINLSDIEQVIITGVGASYIDRDIYGIPTVKTEEFLANGLGGLYMTNLKKAVIVSMGTGTSIISAQDGEIKHLGGTGIGGGTIIGLSDIMLGIRSIKGIINKSESGDLRNIDLMVGDISKTSLPNLPPDTTASNFGNVTDRPSENDIALGILNLVFQSIAMSAVFATKSTDTRDIVLIGNLATLKACNDVFSAVKSITDINFIIPDNAEFATAIGAALVHKTNAGGK
ncbi:MAG: type II pantothenate kinase [Defluviitaleaceae bacterium]|nr:type II pantothenate kinase [Defluviitaleaceae bacterium]